MYKYGMMKKTWISILINSIKTLFKLHSCQLMTHFQLNLQKFLKYFNCCCYCSQMLSLVLFLGLCCAWSLCFFLISICFFPFFLVCFLNIDDDLIYKFLCTFHSFIMVPTSPALCAWFTDVLPIYVAWAWDWVPLLTSAIGGQLR